MAKKKAKKKTSRTTKSTRKKSTKKSGRKKDVAGTLGGLQKSWKKTKPRTIGATVPDDTYEARIETVVIEEAQSSGRMQVTWELKVTDGDYEGRTMRKYSGLETEDNLAFLQGDLETLELPIPDKIEDLGEVLEDAVGLLLEVSVRTKDEFTNVDFVELLEDEGETEAEEEEEVEEEEEEEEEEKDTEEDEADEEEEEEEEEEEGDDDDTITAADIKKMDQDELEEAITDYNFDVDPEKHSTVSKLRRALIAELEE